MCKIHVVADNFLNTYKLHTSLLVILNRWCLMYSSEIRGLFSTQYPQEKCFKVCNKNCVGFHIPKVWQVQKHFYLGSIKLRLNFLFLKSVCIIITLIYVKQHIREYNSICMSKKNVTPISNVEGRKRFVMETWKINVNFDILCIFWKWITIY